MGSAYHLTRTIIDPSPQPNADYTCHVDRVGDVHPGLPEACRECRPALVDDSAMERCGIDDSSHSEPGMQSGSRQTNGYWRIEKMTEEDKAKIGKIFNDGKRSPAFHSPPLWLGWFFLGLMVLATVVAIGACVWR